MSEIDTQLEINTDGTAEVSIGGPPEALQIGIYEPLGVTEPSQIPESTLRIMCKFAVSRAVERISDPTVRLKLTPIPGVIIEYEPNEMDSATRAEVLSPVDLNRFDPDLSPVTLNIVEDRPDPNDKDGIIGVVIYHVLLAPPDLAG